jgi:hypothetical protein
MHDTGISQHTIEAVIAGKPVHRRTLERAGAPDSTLAQLVRMWTLMSNFLESQFDII